MRLGKLIPAGAIAAGFIWMAISLVAQDATKARLSPVPADQKTRADLAGSGSVTATLAGTRLTINGMFEGLKSPATMAELHSGVAAGVRGPLVAAFRKHHDRQDEDDRGQSADRQAQDEL